MDCREIEDLLSAYIDGELTPSEAVSVTSHLSNCKHCRQELIALQQTINLLHDLPEIELPVHFHAQVCERLRNVNLKQSRNKRFKSWYWFPVGASVAAAVLLMIVSFNVITPFTSVPRGDSALSPQSEQYVLQDEALQERIALNGMAKDDMDKTEEAQPEEGNDLNTLALPGAASDSGGQADQEYLIDDQQDTKTNGESASRSELEKAQTPPALADEQDSQSVTAAADPKNLTNRNGSQRERSEEEKYSLPPEIKLAPADANSSTNLVWSVTLQVKDVAHAKKDLAKLAASMNGTILIAGSLYYEISLPQEKLGEALEIIKQYGCPEAEQSSGSTASELLENLYNRQEQLYKKIRQLEDELLRAPNQQVVNSIEEELKTCSEDLKITQNRIKTIANGSILFKINLKP